MSGWFVGTEISGPRGNLVGKQQLIYLHLSASHFIEYPYEE